MNSDMFAQFRTGTGPFLTLTIALIPAKPITLQNGKDGCGQVDGYK